MIKRMIPILFAALWLVVVANSFATETFENVALYVVSESESGPTLAFDGFRSAPFAESPVVSDETNSGIVDVKTLADAIGTAPNLDAAKVGELAGAELNDVVVATATLEDGKITSIVATARLPRPVVGIAWANKSVGNSSKRIADALLRYGARARFMTRVSNDEECEAALKELSGFVMPGGADLDPALYGESPYPHGSIGIEPDRDVSDCLTTRRAIATNLPGLWICRGEQTLNIALGGALIQDIPSYQGANVARGAIPASETEIIPDEGAPATYGGRPAEECMPRHYRVSAYGTRHNSGNRHPIEISESSKFLATVVGSRTCPSVSTSHHQAADPERVGKGLTVVATAPDGIVEALEYQANDFALGVQFHPEMDTRSQDPEIARVSAGFFRELLQFAREYPVKAASDQ